MDFEQFVDYVRQGIEHLGDCSYLETHPLAAMSFASLPGESRGRALRRVLVEAIHALKPETGQPDASLVWRKYQYLCRRYVEDHPPTDIANDLGISVRQSRRYSQEGLAAVTRILWDQWNEGPRWQTHQGTSLQAPKVRLDFARFPPGDLAATADEMIEPENVRADPTELMARVALGELLKGVVTTIQPLAERYDVTLRSSFPVSLPTAVADRMVLRQALLSILILCLDQPCTGLELLVAVGDQATVQVRIHADFADVAAAVSERMVTDEHWHIAEHLFSLQGIPLNLALVGKHRIAITVDLPAAPDTTVLVVEDNDDAIQLYRRYLTGSPYHLASTISTRVLEAVVKEQPVVIVLDVMMPLQDGWEVLQLLKYHPYSRGIPVIVCSVLKERDLALALGAADFLVKPIGRSLFRQALARLAPCPPPKDPGTPEGNP